MGSMVANIDRYILFFLVTMFPIQRGWGLDPDRPGPTMFNLAPQIRGSNKAHKEANAMRTSLSIRSFLMIAVAIAVFAVLFPGIGIANAAPDVTNVRLEATGLPAPDLNSYVVFIRADDVMSDELTTRQQRIDKIYELEASSNPVRWSGDTWGGAGIHVGKYYLLAKVPRENDTDPDYIAGPVEVAYSDPHYLVQAHFVLMTGFDFDTGTTTTSGTAKATSGTLPNTGSPVGWIDFLSSNAGLLLLIVVALATIVWRKYFRRQRPSRQPVAMS